MTPPARQDVVTWITNAWSLLSQRTIKAGFIKARLSPRHTSSMSIQQLRRVPPLRAGLELTRLPAEAEPAVGINAALDIDVDGSSSSTAVVDDVPGCVGDDAGDETSLDEAP
ncbi:hypothetical protein PR003_g10044 [Phytophthora rubi]|uniref:Uncharacterized protein n=1 Tax=Phytophthora rubi TaxID=129364 RepID=A0A6A3N2F2_9STRA|nr:hypothetical protein PR001_g9721 [Phytophthora rubi]KAE9341312.1 hypothetical protein PR003_g10044 [Phytophthora rubi]